MNKDKIIKILEDMNIDTNLISVVEKMSEKEKVKFLEVVTNSMNDEVVSFLSIHNKKLFADYLKQHQRSKSYNQPISLVN